eukprot:7391377-Lingulodinium_polyedra.AAC.1
MVTGGWTGPSLAPPKPLLRAPVLPIAGRFLTAPVAPGGPSLASMTLRFFGLPVGVTNAEARTA